VVAEEEDSLPMISMERRIPVVLVDLEEVARVRHGLRQVHMFAEQTELQTQVEVEAVLPPQVASKRICQDCSVVRVL
jgi:hypothetical protein